MPAAASTGGIGIQLLDAPTSRENDPRAHEYIVDHLAPGAVIQRRVQITSTSNIPLHVDLYAGAATIDGGAFLFATDRTPNDLTSWTTFDSASRNLPPEGTTPIGVTIQVPTTASTGERYAVLWAQVTAADPSATGVRMSSRVGVRVYLDIGPGGEPPSDFQILSLTPARTADGQPQVQAQVRNVGQRALDMTGALSLSGGPASMSAGPFPARLGTTLGIGQTEPVTVPLNSVLPDGPWTARLTLASGTVRHTVTVTLTFPDAAGIGAPVALGGTLPSVAVVYFGGVLLVAGALCAYLLARRRRARRRGYYG
jgi:hypothetical protein